MPVEGSRSLHQLKLEIQGVFFLSVDFSLCQIDIEREGAWSPDAPKSQHALLRNISEEVIEPQDSKRSLLSSHR
jgi:hypothetical protein